MLTSVVRTRVTQNRNRVDIEAEPLVPYSILHQRLHQHLWSTTVETQAGRSDSAQPEDADLSRYALFLASFLVTALIAGG
jgi:hypothetical protein